MSLFENINLSASYLQNLFDDFSPHVAIQTGTGMSSDYPGLTIIKEVLFSEIPHFVTSTAPSHRGRMLFCKWSGIDLIILDGRFHYYEGYSMQQVVYPVYVLKYLNINHLILTNASGSINPAIKDGCLVNITDHINMHHGNPLRGKNDDRIGPRFPNMSQAYDKQGSVILKECAAELDISLHEGVYLGLPGPNFETPAEYRMARLIGADVVGMSTVPEVIAANHCGLRVNAVSIVSNQFDPQNEHKGSDLEEVLTNVKLHSKKLMELILAAIKQLPTQT